MTNPAAEAAALHLARRYDEVVRAALVKRLGLGITEWTPELRARVFVRGNPDGETYHLDGEPFLWMGPIRMTESNGAISVDREWKEL